MHTNCGSSDDGDDMPHIQLSPGHRTRQDLASDVSVRYDYNPRASQEIPLLTVPTSIVHAPDVIMHFRPRDSPKKVEDDQAPRRTPNLNILFVSRRMSVNATEHRSIKDTCINSRCPGMKSPNVEDAVCKWTYDQR